ncbi:MAG: phosphotransferase [Pseudomonadota bacterium]|nr:phosphotransferase [Pseudomonadota bacterium]
MTLAPLSPDFLRQRTADLEQWFLSLLPRLDAGSVPTSMTTSTAASLRPVSGDASFRRYFRGVSGQRTWILVDAPPERENSKPFIDVASLLSAGGVAAPVIVAADLERGFMCLEDFGDTVLWTPLDAARRDSAQQPDATTLYQLAFDELLLIQRCDAAPLPPYDDALLLREMRLFTEWFCGGLMQYALDDGEHAMLEAVYGFLSRAVRAQPQVFVHRDYHSRNLMYRPSRRLGVIDFQDAVRGPVTYDLVSLLKDCYIEWPRAQVNAWALDYAGQAQRAGIVGNVDAAAFLRAFDLMGAQRHLKVLGIFSRLWLRDGKRGYLRDIPLTMRYLVTVLPEHPELAEFARWLDARVLPQLDAALARANAAADAAAAANASA